MLKTVDEHAFKATAWVLFPDIDVATNAVIALKDTSVDAVEILDRASLASVHSPGIAFFPRKLFK